MPAENLNLERVDKTETTNEVANIVTQTEAWFDARKDQMNDLANHLKQTQSIDLNGIEIKDKNVIKGMRIGLMVAQDILGKFPIKLKPIEPVNQVDDEG